MSKYSEARTYSLDAKVLSDAMIAAAQAAGLREKSRSDDAVVVGEPFKLLKFSWPAKITATLKPSGPHTSVDYIVSNFGFGPLQTAACKNALKKLTDGLADKEVR
jgi:hypothetical protein